MANKTFSFSSLSDWEFFSGIEDSVSQFEQGFSMQLTPMIDLSTGTRTSQLQEFIALDDPNDPEALIGYYSAFENPEGNPSAIWRCQGLKATPNIWTNHSEILTSTAAEMDYVRLGSVTWDGSTYRFFLSGGGDGVYKINSSDGINFSGLPELIFTSSTDPVDSGPVSLFSAIIINGVHWGVYTVNAATPSSQYRLAYSADGDTWTKQNQTILTVGTGADQGGFEWHFLNTVGSNLVMSYEAWNGTNAWTEMMAYAPLSNFTGTWTKLPNPVLVANPASSFAKVNVATPSFRKIGAQWYMFFQGVNEVPGFPTGSGGPWKIGFSTLNS